MLGFYLLPRTVDKLRAELSGGHLGPYVNEERGLSAYLVRRLGLHMDEFRAAVADAADEDAIKQWLAARIDTSAAPTLNAKLDTFVVERLPPEDQVRIRERHPVMAAHPELSTILDIIAADDQHPG